MTPQKIAELRARALANVERDKAEKLAKQKAAEEEACNLLKTASPAVIETLADKFLQKQTAQVFTSEASFKPLLAQHTYNPQQLEAIESGMRGKSMCLIGAAGTGKTTTTREIVAQMQRLAHVRPIESSTGYLTKDAPGIVILGFTNKAVNNIKRLLPEALKRHCLTIHKVLEFEPVRDEDGKICGFAPKYDQTNPLPYISVAFFEESSMIGTELYHTWRNALPLGCEPQEIFLGDLNQLPPIFGPSILGYKLLELHTVELTHVYRQALESPIIFLAHSIRQGKSLPWKVSTKKGDPPHIVDALDHGKVTLLPWKKRLPEIAANKTLANMMTTLIGKGEYDPETDIILCPFNVKVGQIELNNYIADYLGACRGAEVWEVIARGKKRYFAEGDRVIYDRQEAKILSITHTIGYGGKIAQEESKNLDRWGHLRGSKLSQSQVSGEEAGSKQGDGETETFSLDDPLQDPEDSWAHSTIDEQQKNAASHTLELELLDSGVRIKVSDSGSINNMLFAYVQTVHKSQGSEWQRVFILLHHCHNVMLTRELMYTAITRAKKELFIVFDPGFEGSMDSLTKAARSPEIKGVTLAEKAEYFKGKKQSSTPMPTREQLVRKSREAKEIAAAGQKSLVETILNPTTGESNEYE